MTIRASTYDFYDDGGALLKGAISDLEDIPDFVKTAAQVGHTGHVQQYALVMVDDGHVMKKFATADAGNTWLSTLYFGLTRQNLPEMAQKVAASHLIDACEAYEIEAPDFLWDIADLPVESNIVDVTGQRPLTKIAFEREDVDFAITRADGSNHYPLRDAKDVTTAMDYFERHAGQFVPRERREFAVKVAAKARQGALPLSEKIASYAGSTFNPAVEAHLTTRYLHLMQAEALPEVKERLIKLAHLRTELGPYDFAERLEQFDLTEGLDALWDREVADPWYSTFGGVKTAAPARTRVLEVAGTSVTEEQLYKLATESTPTVTSHFGASFATEFSRDPVTQFEAMPVPQRRLLAQLATTGS